MRFLRIPMAIALLLACGPVLAQAASVVKVTLSGTGPNVVVTGVGSGILEDNVLRLLGTMIRTEFNENGTISVWTQDLDTRVDFSQLEGDWETSNCVDVSGPAYCVNDPPSTGTWDSVAGTAFAFTTTENGTTVTWTVTQPDAVPTMPYYGLGLMTMGLLWLAGRRLGKMRAA